MNKVYLYYFLLPASAQQPHQLIPDWCADTANKHRLEGAVQQCKRIGCKKQISTSDISKTGDQKGNRERSNANKEESSDYYYFQRDFPEQPGSMIIRKILSNLSSSLSTMLSFFMKAWYPMMVQDMRINVVGITKHVLNCHNTQKV